MTAMINPVKLAAFAGQEAYLCHDFMALFHASFRTYFRTKVIHSSQHHISAAAKVLCTARSLSHQMNRR